MQALADYAAQTDPLETTLEARTLTACTTPLEWMQAAEHLRGNGDHVVIQGTKTSAYDELNAFCQGHMNEPACAHATPG
jgi:hypothetical protein